MGSLRRDEGRDRSLTLGLSREVAAEGVRVNAVAPGLVHSEMPVAADDPGRLNRMASTVPMGRPGNPLEIAQAPLWLLAPAASYVAGAILPVTGGR